MSAAASATLRPIRWAVIGQGRAGRARVRDLDVCATAELAVALSARALGAPPADGREVTQLVASCPQGLIIATANGSHGAWARAALRAGWHALVEFPLCATADEGRDLYRLAAQRGLVLHVEFIGLLTAAHASFTHRLVGAEVTALHCTFSGGLGPWLNEEMACGHLGQLAIGRLQALWQLAGPLRLASVDCRPGDAGYDLRVQLSGANGARVQLDETRAAGLARRSRLWATLADGRQVERGTMFPGEALFLADLEICNERVQSHGALPGYVTEQQVVGVLALAEAISAACQS